MTPTERAPIRVHETQLGALWMLFTENTNDCIIGAHGRDLETLLEQAIELTARLRQLVAKQRRAEVAQEFPELAEFFGERPPLPVNVLPERDPLETAPRNWGGLL